VPLDSGSGFFIPVDHLVLQDTASLVCRMNGRPVPQLKDAELIGWSAEIRLPCGTDASPPDGPMFPNGGHTDYDAGYRILTPPTTLRIPRRNRPDLFTTIGLGMNLEDNDDAIRVSVDPGDGQAHAIDMSGLAAWFPLRGEGVGATDVIIRVAPESTVKLNRAKSLVAHRALAFTANRNGRDTAYPTRAVA
jgi:hypothetical protein